MVRQHAYRSGACDEDRQQVACNGLAYTATLEASSWAAVHEAKEVVRVSWHRPQEITNPRTVWVLIIHHRVSWRWLRLGSRHLLLWRKWPRPMGLLRGRIFLVRLRRWPWNLWDGHIGARGWMDARENGMKRCETLPVVWPYRCYRRIKRVIFARFAYVQTCEASTTLLCRKGLKSSFR